MQRKACPAAKSIRSVDLSKDWPQQCRPYRLLSTAWRGVGGQPLLPWHGERSPARASAVGRLEVSRSLECSLSVLTMLTRQSIELDGSLVKKDSRRWHHSLGNALWHTVCQHAFPFGSYLDDSILTFASIGLFIPSATIEVFDSAVTRSTSVRGLLDTLRRHETSV